MWLSGMIGIIELAILFSLKKSPPLYICRCTLVSLSSLICRHDCNVSPHLAMVIRVVGSDRAVNTIWHGNVWFKPVRLYNVTIVIRCGGLSSFQNCPNNLSVVRLCLAIVVCVPVCLYFVAPSHVKSVKI